MFIQVMTEAEAKLHKHNPFDLTKVWPKRDYPLIEVGVMELNCYPDNYFAEVEQAAFSPANIVPGIGFSPDKVLQSRLFSYGDTQRYRLGVNFNHIPVNAPKCPFQSYHRDGQMRTDGNLGSTLSFHPNSAGLWSNQPDFDEPPMPVDGDGAHYDHRLNDDHWEQPGSLFRKMTPEQQKVLFENTVRAMGDARPHIKQRHVENCTRADPAYGAGIARARWACRPCRWLRRNSRQRPNSGAAVRECGGVRNDFLAAPAVARIESRPERLAVVLRFDRERLISWIGCPSCCSRWSLCCWSRRDLTVVSSPITAMGTAPWPARPVMGRISKAPSPSMHQRSPGCRRQRSWRGWHIMQVRRDTTR